MRIVSISVILLLVILPIYLYQVLRKKNQLIKKLEGDLLVLKNTGINPNLEVIETVLNPHLFKNILNSVQSHAYQTYFALDKLANILDYILYESKNKYVTPQDEIEFARNLIEVNRIKLSPLFELSVKTRIDETCSLYNQKILAPLISIDLIENAFKHADLQSQDAYISIVFEFKNNVFTLIVSNKISPKEQFQKKKSGIGNVSFEQRLKLLYQDCYSFERLIDDGAFIAHLKIDLNEYKNKKYNS